MLKTLERTYLAVFRAYPLLIVLAAIAFMAEFVYASLNNVIVPLYLDREAARLGVNPARLGWAVGSVIATFLAVETLIRIPAGALSDRFGRRLFIAGAPLLTCFSPVLLASVSAFWMFYPLRAIDGLGAATLWPPLLALVGDHVARESRATAMSVINMVYVSGLALGLWVSNLVIGYANSATLALYLCAAMLAAAGLVALLRLPHAPPGHAHAAHLDADDDYVAARPISGARVAAMLVITAGQTFSVIILAPFLELYVTRDLHVAPQHLALLFVVPGAAVALTAMPLGRAADRIGKGFMAKAGMGGGAVALWLMPFARTPLGMLGVVTLLGVAVAAAMPAWLALLTELAPRRSRGFTVAYFGTAQGLGASAAALLGGVIWDIRHAYLFHAAAATLTLCTLLAAVSVHSD
jgi:MFS family permease